MIGPQITFEEHQKRTNTKFKNTTFENYNYDKILFFICRPF